MPRPVALSLCLAACAPAAPGGPAAEPPRPTERPASEARPLAAGTHRSNAPGDASGPDCLDLDGAARRHLQRGPDGALWLERWTVRPAPRGELVRVDPATGAERPVLMDILTATVAGERLIALRTVGEARGLLSERRRLTLSALDGADERPLSPPEHAVTSHALGRSHIFYTTEDGALHRRRLAPEPRGLDDAPGPLADGVLAVHAELPTGELLISVARGGRIELAVRTDAGAVRPLGVEPGPLALSTGHVLLDTPGGVAELRLPGSRAIGDVPRDTRRPGAPRSLAPGLHLLPGGLLLGPAGELRDPALPDPLARAAGAAIAEAVPVPEAIWALVRHDTDGDGDLTALADEADLCRLARDPTTPQHLPPRDRPRRLAAVWPALARLAAGDLSRGTLTAEAGALVLRTPDAGPPTLAALRARAAEVHRDAARLVGAPDLDLVLEWAGNDRRADVSWDSRLARPAIAVQARGLAVPDAPVRADHRLTLTPLPDGRHRVACEGHVRHDLPAPAALELRCAARLGPGDPDALAAATAVLRDMPPQTPVPFFLDLGALELRPTASDLWAGHPAGALTIEPPTALADLDDLLTALDRAADLGFVPTPRSPHPPARGAVHAPLDLAAPPGFADLPPAERDRRARALWALLAAHAERHHGGRLAPTHLVGTGHVIRRGRLE